MTVAIDHGVLSDSAVSAQGTPDTTVNVATGKGLYTNAQVDNTGNAALDILTGNPADATNDRIDLVVLDSTGTPTQVVGTAAAVPQQPDTAHITLAAVYVYSQANANYTGTITSSVIQDLRRFIRLPEPAESFAYTYLGAVSSADPGSGNLGVDSTSSPTHLYVSYLTPSAIVGINAWLRQQNPSGQGIMPFLLRLWSRTDPSNFVLLGISSATDNSTWADLGVSGVYASSSSTFNKFGGLSTTSLDTIVEWAGPLGVGANPFLTAATTLTTSNGSAFLGGDVTMTTAGTFYDGPTTGSIGASRQVLLLLGQVTIVGGAGGANKITARLTDGTTVFNEGESAATASSPNSISLFAIVTPSAAATYKITATSTQNSATMKRDPPDNSSGAHVATAIGWVRLA